VCCRMLEDCGGDTRETGTETEIEAEMNSNGWTVLLIAPSLLALLSSSVADGGRPKDRYFLSGDGWIHLANAKTGQSARVHYRLPDGSYPPDARRQIDRLSGVPPDSADHIALRLISF